MLRLKDGVVQKDKLCATAGSSRSISKGGETGKTVSPEPEL